MAGGPLRILQLYPKGDFFTGAAIQLRDLARGLAARGHHVTVATPPERALGRALPRGRRRARRRSRCAAPGTRARPGGWRRLIRAQRIQVAHAHKGRARTLTLLAGLMGARALLVLNRGVSFPCSTRVRPRSATRAGACTRSSRSASRSSDGLVAAGVPAGKIEVIYSGTDLERFHPGRRRRRRSAASSASPPSTSLITQIGVRSWRGWRDVLDGACARVAPRGVRARGCSSSGAPPPRIARARAIARARSGSAAACSCSATATTCRRSSPPPTWSSTPPTPGSASPARSARRSPASGRWWPPTLEGMPELVRRRRDRACWCRRAIPTRSPPPPCALARRSRPRRRRWRARAASAWRRTSRCAPSSTPPRRSTGAGRRERRAMTHAVAVYRRLLPLHAAATCPSLIVGARCWPSSWPPWRAPSRGW